MTGLPMVMVANGDRFSVPICVGVTWRLQCVQTCHALGNATHSPVSGPLKTNHWLLVTIQVLLYATCLRTMGELFGSAAGKGLCVYLPVCAKFSTYPSSAMVAVDTELLFNTDVAVASLTSRRCAATMYWSFILLFLCVPPTAHRAGLVDLHE